MRIKKVSAATKRAWWEGEKITYFHMFLSVFHGLMVWN